MASKLSIFAEDEDDAPKRPVLPKLPDAQNEPLMGLKQPEAVHEFRAPEKPAAPRPAARPTARDFSYLLESAPAAVTPASKTAEDDGDDDADEDAQEGDKEEEVDVAALMGFGAFGTKKVVKEKKEKVKEMRASDVAQERRRQRHASDEFVAPPEALLATRDGVAAAAAADAGSAGEAAGPVPARGGEGDGESDEDDEEDAGAVEAVDSFALPISGEITLAHGKRALGAIDLDPAGARLVTGGFDCELRFWDFAGMDASLKAFRSVTPAEGVPIRGLVYSNSGDALLVTPGNSQAKVYDRDGKELYCCDRGDMYIVDLARTTGHVAALNCGAWHPTNHRWFLTGSADSTIRGWDLDNRGKKSVMVVKARSRAGKKSGVAAMAVRDAKMLAAGCQDGSIQLFQLGQKTLTAGAAVHDAHAPDASVSSVRFAADHNTLLSRATDGTVKLWDIRKFKAPLAIAEKIDNHYDIADCIFSPDERLVLTGFTSPEGKTGGGIAVLDAQTLEPRQHIGLTRGGAVRLLWHPKINQLIAGTNSGEAVVYYDEKRSFRGALMCARRAPRKADPFDMQFGDVSGTIIAPHNLKLFRDDNIERQKSTIRKEIKRRKDPVASRMPERPVELGRAGKQGRVTGVTATLAQFVAKQTSYDRTRDEDPREAILRHAEKADADPYWVAPAYKETQPQPVFNFDAEDDTGPSKKRKFDPTKRPLI